MNLKMIKCIFTVTQQDHQNTSEINKTWTHSELVSQLRGPVFEMLVCCSDAVVAWKHLTLFSVIRVHPPVLPSVFFCISVSAVSAGDVGDAARTASCSVLHINAVLV